MKRSFSSMVTSYSEDLWVHGLGNDRVKPSFFNFSVTNACNARCVMCDIWKHPIDDANASTISRFFSNHFLSETKGFGITGGEPFLRTDLAEIIVAAKYHFKNLKHIGITTNGFNSSRTNRLISEILHASSGTDLDITISLDGLGEIHDKSRGVTGVSRKTLLTLNSLADVKKNVSGLGLNVACTITNANASYDALTTLRRFCADLDVPTIFRLAVDVDRIYNSGLMESAGVTVNSREALEVVRFLKELTESTYSARNVYYQMMIDVLLGAKSTRAIKCKEMRDGVMVDSAGEVYVCSVSGERIGNLLLDSAETLQQRSKEARASVRESRCSKCMHDHLSYKSPTQLLKSIANRIV